jgi:methyl-accepting chemotaxis protein
VQIFETGLMTRWFSALSIRWKLQFSFFLVTMVTIVFVRWGGYQELVQLIEIARQSGVAAEVITQLDARLSAYVTSALWQSVLELTALFLVIAILAKRFVAPIESLCGAAKNIEQGDLTQTVETTAKDEIGTLARSFNAMSGGLTKIVRNIDDNSSQMAQSAYQVASIAHEIDQTSNEEYSLAKGMTGDAEALIAISESVQEMAQQVFEHTRIANEGAQEGIAYVGGNVDRMEATMVDVSRASDQVAELKGAAQQIYDIIGTIRAIAEQTNLLALNAAIEAARAGESGRGFAVVADEVRDLASRTTESTAKITEIINQVNDQVGQVSDSMEAVVDRVNGSQERAREAGTIITRIAGDISNAANSSQQIAEVSGSQLGQLQQLQNGLGELYSSVQENAAKIQSTANIGDDLYQVTESLRSILGQFTYEKTVVETRGKNEQRATPRLTHQLRVQFMQGEKHYEGICSDLSMTGMKLRLPEELDKNVPLKVSIFIPFEDLKQYEAQKPIALTAQLVWQRTEQGKLQGGIKFTDINAAQKQELENCFAYFHQEASYS